jgi:hypothetical protein
VSLVLLIRITNRLLGVDVCGKGNLPTEDKHAAFWAIKPPHTFADLCMLIGIFGFYSWWLPNYEIRIEHWRWIIKQQPAPGSATPALERDQNTFLFERCCVPPKCGSTCAPGLEKAQSN